MSIRIQILTTFFLMVVCTEIANSQSPAFSQFYAAPLFLNPALIGGDNAYKISLNYKTFRYKQLNNYSLGHFSIVAPVHLPNLKRNEKYFKNGYIGNIGLNLYNELSGKHNELKITGINIAIAYFLQINYNQYICFGLQGGIIQKNIRFDHLQWGSQYTPDIGYNSNIIPSIQLIGEQKNMLVINSGITWFYNIHEFNPLYENKTRVFAGFALSNMNQPDQSFSGNYKIPMPILYKLHGGLVIPINQKIEILPNCLIMRQNKHNYLNLGTYMAYYLIGKSGTTNDFYQIQLGFWYRKSDAFITSLGLEMKNLIIGISYDFNLSEYSIDGKGKQSIEVSITYKTGKRTVERKHQISNPII